MLMHSLVPNLNSRAVMKSLSYQYAFIHTHSKNQELQDSLNLSDMRNHISQLFANLRPRS